MQLNHVKQGSQIITALIRNNADAKSNITVLLSTSFLSGSMKPHCWMCKASETCQIVPVCFSNVGRCWWRLFNDQLFTPKQLSVEQCTVLVHLINVFLHFQAMYFPIRTLYLTWKIEQRERRKFLFLFPLSCVVLPKLLNTLSSQPIRCETIVMWLPWVLLRSLLHVFPRLPPVTRFPALAAGSLFSRAYLQLHIFPRLPPVTCFPALASSYVFSRACPQLHVFPRKQQLAYFPIPGTTTGACFPAFDKRLYVNKFQYKRRFSTVLWYQQQESNLQLLEVVFLKQILTPLYFYSIFQIKWRPQQQV